LFLKKAIEITGATAARRPAYKKPFPQNAAARGLRWLAIGHQAAEPSVACQAEAESKRECDSPSRPLSESRRCEGTAAAFENVS